MATPEVSFNTGFEEGTELTHIERVRRVNGEGLILDRNLFRTSAVPGITEEIARTSVYDYAERELGVTIATSKRTITVERAVERDRARKLPRAPRTPRFLLARWRHSP